MANKTLFANRGVQKAIPTPDTRNEAGGMAYTLSAKAALAQYAVTGTFNSVYYVNADDQLKRVEELVKQVDSPFIAKLAVYARENGRMKDTPAYLLATLAARGEVTLLRNIFPRVCTNAKMLCNFVQIIRSGAVGRRSFGTAVKRMIQDWLTSRNNKSLFMASVGHSDPSLADIIKMVHPRPNDMYQQNMFSYLLGREFDLDKLPRDLITFECLKRGQTSEIPDVPFRVLTNCNLGANQWRQVAMNMPWDTLRQNLAQLGRKGVFDDRGFTRSVAEKLANADEVKRCNVFPYQLLTAYQNATEVPTEVRNALQQAMEVAVENVPVLPGDTMIAIDVSGSMSSAVTGNRGSTTSVTRCVDVAALIASSLLRKNQNHTLVLAFDAAGWGSRYKNGQVMGGLYRPEINPYDSVMTNAQRLASYGGGGTDCSLPFQFLNNSRLKYDNLILVSDNESWSGRGGIGGTCAEWVKYNRTFPKSKLVNIDLQPYPTTQVPDTAGKVMNVGGWSDTVFVIMNEFFKNDPTTNFVKVIEGIEV